MHEASAFLRLDAGRKAERDRIFTLFRPSLGLPMVAQRNEHRHGGDDLVDRDAAVPGRIALGGALSRLYPLVADQVAAFFCTGPDSRLRCAANRSRAEPGS